MQSAHISKSDRVPREVPRVLRAARVPERAAGEAAKRAQNAE